jgi:hypothetical protein
MTELLGGLLTAESKEFEAAEAAESAEIGD